MDRRKNKDVLWWAFKCAKQDRQALAEAYGNHGPEAEDVMADIRAFDRLEKALLGEVRGTALDDLLSGGEALTIEELKKRMEKTQ